MSDVGRHWYSFMTQWKFFLRSFCHGEFFCKFYPDRLEVFAISISVKLPRSRMYCARRSDGIFESDSRSSGEGVFKFGFTFSEICRLFQTLLSLVGALGCCVVVRGQFAFAVSAAEAPWV
ncbi:MAG: hypothetical protein ACLUKN_03105 [Bacilli bacterium]